MILVTGGAGFIGGNYIKKFINDDLVAEFGEVLCVDNLTYASNISFIENLIEYHNVEFFKVDIADRSSMGYLFSEYKHQIKYIVNFAAETHVDNSIANFEPFIYTNVLGTINLMKHALEVPNLKKFVHISTDEVYGSLDLDDPNSFTENNPHQTNSPYSASKASSDCFARAFYKTYGLPVVITNCSNNYGPNQNKEKLIPKVCYNALNDQKIPVYGDGKNVRDWLYVDDHCDAINLILQKGIPGEKYNIGGGTEIANIDLVKMILKLLHKDESLIQYVTDRVGHDRRYSIDCSKLENLGYKPKHSLQDGLNKTINWYELENGKSNNE